MTVVLVHHFLEHSARRRPDKTALICDGRRLTYADLDGLAEGLAARLRAAGVGRGDRVAIFLDNSVEAVVALFAALKAGGVFVVVNPTTKADKLAYIVGNCRAVAVVTDDRRCAGVAEALAGLPHRPAVVSPRVAPAGRGPVPPAIDADLAGLIYTSGSTGRPKGVMTTHLNVVTTATSITTYLENTEDDVIVNVLPLAFDYGLYQVFMAFQVGATLVLERSFTYPWAVIDTIVREGVTGLPIVPTMAAILLQLDLRRVDFSRLRYLTNTAAALPAAHIRQLRALFPHVALYSMYGLTECKRVSYLPPVELDRRITSTGIAIPNTEVYIVDEADRRVGPGVVGELVVRGSHVTRGYWELPEETQARFRPGPLPGEHVLYTGDLFRMDADGYLYFVARKDDIIKTRGEKVSPREVEEVLHGHPAVAEAVVTGVSDPVLGEAIRAVVTVRPGAHVTAADIRRHCRARLEDFMVPRLVDFVDHLPMTATGKVARRQLGRQSRSAGVSATVAFSADVLAIEPGAETARIAEAIRRAVTATLRRRGVVLGLSGGVDSSVVAALCARALGPRRVLGLLMPEADSSPDSLRLGRLVADALGIDTVVEDVTPVLAAAGCYRRRDAAIRTVVPEYGEGWQSKLVLSDTVGTDRYAVFSVVARAPDGSARRARLTAEAYLDVVAATSFKQRARKMMEYYHADRLQYAVAGTPNRLEYDQGFFVKSGDGAADLKPIAHLYKSQVYALAHHLGIPEEVQRRPPTTDTYSLAQSQEEFYFGLPLAQMDLALYARTHGVPPSVAAPALGLDATQVERVYTAIDRKRQAARRSRLAPLLVDHVEDRQ